MIGRISLILLAATGFAAPAQADYPANNRVWFSEGQAAAGDKLVSMCAQLNMPSIQRSEGHISCQRDVSGANGVAVQAAGSGYSGSANYAIRFELSPDRGTTRVDMYQGVGAQWKIPGPLRVAPATFPKQRRALLDVLMHIGGSPTRPMR